MNFLLVNDDGIDAPGLAALINGLSGLGRVVTAAPQEAHSGCGHQVTSKRPIMIAEKPATAEHELKRWAVAGTPADCIRLAITTLCPAHGLNIDWVVSGINAGANLGVDIYTSGTVAGAREAAFLGIPAIAVSQHINQKSIGWELTQQRAAYAIQRIFALPGRAFKRYWNINLPHTEDVRIELETVFCGADTNPMQITFVAAGENAYLYSGAYRNRPHLPGADIAHCFAGKISITELSV